MAAFLTLLLTSTLAAKVQAAEIEALFNFPQTVPNLKACLDEPLQYSCENTTAIANTCCSPTPGGLVLQTQFWDTHTGLESKGQKLPQGSWGIHGLWPDFCDGSYTQYCDLSRQYDPYPSPNTTNGLPNGTYIAPYTGPGVDSFILDFGRIDLLTFMEKYWINQYYPNEELWAHEFSKHATCTSTFDVECFANYKEHEDVINFYDSVVRAFKMFPTYDIFAAAGITPSNKTTYTLAALEKAAMAQTGAIPYFGCTGSKGTVLDEVWYFNHVQGTEQYGHYKPLNSTTPSSCATSGIWYYERARDSERDVSLFP